MLQPSDAEPVPVPGVVWRHESVPIALRVRKALALIAAQAPKLKVQVSRGGLVPVPGSGSKAGSDAKKSGWAKPLGYAEPRSSAARGHCERHRLSAHHAPGSRCVAERPVLAAQAPDEPLARVLRGLASARPRRESVAA